MGSAKKLGKRKAEPPSYLDEIIEDSKKKIKTEPGLDVDHSRPQERPCSDEDHENDDKKIAACVRFLADVGQEPETKGAAIKLARHRLLSALRRSSDDEVSCLTWLDQRNGLGLQSLGREALHRVAEIVQDAEVNEIVELFTRRTSSPVAIRSVRKLLKAKLQQLEQGLLSQEGKAEGADEEVSWARQDFTHAARDGEHAKNRPAENTEQGPKAGDERLLPPCPSPGNKAPGPASNESQTPSSTNRRVDTLAAPSGPSSLKPTMIDHVQFTKEQRFVYVLLPLNTPEAPIFDASEKEVTLACRAAFNTRAKVCSVQRLGDRMWYVCFEKVMACRQKPQLVNSAIILRGVRVIANYLPALPCRSFVADVPRSTSVSPHAILASLTPELDARRCNGLTLLHQTSAGRSRFIAYFAEHPNLLRFYVPVQGGKGHLIFRPDNERALCWCKMYHNGKPCSAGVKYEYRHGLGGVGTWN
ncbi:hypothetical protein AC579_7211 [Pseudocercospora musae]|uniref:Uncharacterized protein n=1 Tax=Pseudocercospora musae TaxID=113226 RepID=A0A139H8W8_9PEZI|nr:hypothetical protein AC579_7211 [Pseudocercospora musae]